MQKNLSSLSGTPTEFFYNGLCVTFSSIALKLASMFFNVYLSALAGAGAMGLLSMIYGIWGFAVTLGCGSGGFCSSRICASEVAQGRDLRKCSSMCIRYCAICGGICSAFLFFSAPFLGKHVLHDIRCIPPLKILAVSLPFISAGGSIEGYFVACTRTYKVSVLKLFDQAARICLTVAMFGWRGYSSPYIACMNIIISNTVIEILFFFILLLVFYTDRRKFCEDRSESGCSYPLILKTSLPITLGSSLRSGLVSTEHIIIPKALILFGFTYDKALSSFGTIRGMSLPTILFCYAMPSAYASLLIPKIVECNSSSNQKELLYFAKRAYRAVICFAFAVSAFLILSSGILGNILYPRTNAGTYIYALAPLIPIMYIDSVSDSFLKGMNLQTFSMKINILDSLISIVCVIFLVPKFGMSGYIAAIYISETFNTCASLSKVISITGYKMPVLSYIIMPLACAVISAYMTKLLYSFLYSHISTELLILFGAVFFVSVYIILLTITRTLKREERRWIKKVVLPS